MTNTTPKCPYCLEDLFYNKKEVLDECVNSDCIIDQLVLCFHVNDTTKEVELVEPLVDLEVLKRRL